MRAAPAAGLHELTQSGLIRVSGRNISILDPAPLRNCRV
jgi:hypothetical protein